jgi:hypothetical protein
MRLNEIWNDPLNTDNTILIRVLNTFLESGNDNSQIIFNSIGYFTKLFNELLTTTKIHRPDIQYVVTKIQNLEITPSFDNFTDLLGEICNKNAEEYKYFYYVIAERFLNYIIQKTYCIKIQNTRFINHWVKISGIYF